MLSLDTVRIEGRLHRLEPRAPGARNAGWALRLIEDPQQQHLVHLLAAELFPHAARTEWTELMLELERELEERFDAIEVEHAEEAAAA